MKKIMKWLGIVLGSIGGLLVILMLGLYFKTESQTNKIYDVKVESIEIPTDAESIERGKHLTDFLCAECHGDDLSGKPNWVSIENLAVISPPNLTSGKGSVISNFSNEDWVRVLRHGVKTDGHSVFVMPSETFQYLSPEDLADILAYLKTAPPVDTVEMTTREFTFLGKVAYGAGAFGNLTIASKIDHANLPTSFPEPRTCYALYRT
jgi:mono/diheme cytochrome c family protein